MEDPIERFLRRRRRNYFELNDNNQRIQRDQIRKFLDGSYLQRFCQSIGLKVKEIRLVEIDDNNNDYNNQEDRDAPTRIIVDTNYSDEFKLEQWMIAKDLTNTSKRKFRLWRKIIKKIYFDRIPGWRDIEKKQLEKIVKKP